MTAVTADCLRRLSPVGDLSTPRLEELAGLCRVESHPLGVNPLQGIDYALELVYLLSGELKIVTPDNGTSLLVGGCDAANRAIGYQRGAPLSAKAVTPVELLRIDHDLLDIMMTWDQLSFVAQARTPDEPPADWANMSGAFNVQALTSGALAALPPAHIHELLQRFERIRVTAGQVVIREGEEGDYYYLIESGRCQVSRRLGGTDLLLAELKPGDAFGEEALVSDTRRNASVTMKSAGVLLRLAKPDFDELLRTPLLHALSVADARRRVEDGAAVWLDVRYPAEFAENGLPGAINVPLNEIRQAFGVLDKRCDYVVYCRSGRRSSAAAFLLVQNGFAAQWLQGGLLAVEDGA